MIKAVLIDDEQHCRDHLKEVIRESEQDIDVIAEAGSGKEGLKVIHDMDPDIVFLDIEMPDFSGFELLQKTGPIRFEIIFTTAFDKYAIRAIKASALDFLLKPINHSDFATAMERYHKKKSIAKSKEQFDILFENIKRLGDPLKKIMVPTLSGFEFVNIKDIIRLEGDSNYTKLFFTDKRKIHVSKTLKEFEELLSDHNFFRIHLSHLINMRCIKNFSRGEKTLVYLDDGSQLEVSRRRKDEFIKALDCI